MPKWLTFEPGTEYIPKPAPEMLARTKPLQRKVLLVILVSEKRYCLSEIPREDVFREPCHRQTCSNLNECHGPVIAY
jgi:hypothetical protein